MARLPAITLGLASAVALSALGCTHITPPPGSAERADALCRERHPDAPAERAFTTDGCTGWPDGVWRDCCIEHDMAYWCGGGRQERAAADRELERCVEARGHPIVGRLMWTGVRVGGVPEVPAPWRWGYGKPWPTLYTSEPPKDACEEAPE